MKPLNPGIPILVKPPIDERHRHPGHFLDETAQAGNVAGVSAVINHTDAAEEQCRHRAVTEHLQARARHADQVHRGETHAHQTHMADGREADNVLEVALAEGDERAIHDIDQRQENDPGKMNLRPFRHQLHTYPQRRICAEFHQHTGMDHRYRSWRGDVTIRRPVVEGEHTRQHREADEDEREPEFGEGQYINTGITGNIKRASFSRSHEMGHVEAERPRILGDHTRMLWQPAKDGRALTAQKSCWR